MSYPDQGHLDECQCHHSALRIRSRRSASHSPPLPGAPSHDLPITLSELRILAVVAVRERRRHTLGSPDAFAGAPGVVLELLVAIGKIAINRGARRVDGWI